jgi:hypothetical protein
MSPLERRYRWLLRMLPADHRAARGEELLGLLLDLDNGRTRPSIRQWLGVLALALRLRLANAVILLVTAYLVAAAAVDVVTVVTAMIQLHTGAIQITPGRGHSLPFVEAVTIVASVGWLAVAVAWILGARRVALGFAVPLLTALVWPFGWGELDLTHLVIVALLGAGVLWRWPAPRPRRLLLWAVPGSVSVLLLAAAWQWHGVTVPTVDPRLSWLTAAAGGLAGAVIAVLLAGRPLSARLVAVAAGAGLGALAPAALVTVVYGLEGWTLSLTVTIALLGVAGSRIRRHPLAPTANPATEG